MALELWSKLENAGDVTSPQLGTGGAEVGSPTYPAAKFNNGILSDIDNEGCTFPTGPNSINLDKGTIEFWAKMNFTPVHGAYHALFDFLDYASGGILLRFNPSIDDFNIYVYTGGAVVVAITTTGLSWNWLDLLHFAVTWDRQGNDIGGGKTIVLYVDGIEKASSTTTWSTDIVNANLYIGIDEGQIRHSDAVIDNLKTYDTCKTDFSDRETEGVNTAPTAPTSLLCEGQSSPVSDVTDLTPEFSAIFNDPDSGDIANAVQIQVGTTPGASDMWDSGWIDISGESLVEGNRCNDRSYAGTALSLDGSTYYWKIRFRDDDDAEGAWSSNVQFTMGTPAPPAPAVGGLLSQIW